MHKNSALSLLLVTLLLQGCATVASVCPKLPEVPVLAPPGQSFLTEMRAILSASQPEPTKYELISKPAARGLKQ